MITDPASILIVEDEEEIREALRDYTQSRGYYCEDFSSAEEAMKRLQNKDFELVISDMKLPGMDGIELSKKIKLNSPDTNIIIITAYGHVSPALEAIEFGADDYILKPFSLPAIDHSINKVFEKRRLKAENESFQAELEKKVEARKREIEEAGRGLSETFYKTIHILGNSQECRETFLRGRTERITILAYRTAKKLGFDERLILQLLLGAPISDIGKLAISETILNKPGPLDETEVPIIRQHVESGVQIISNLAHFGEVRAIIRHHHERYDGTGYPDGLKGNDIPSTARVVAICDSFDAMTHARPWRAALDSETALSEIKALAGKAYDPDFVEAFIAAVKEFGLDSLIGLKPTEHFLELILPELIKTGF